MRERHQIVFPKIVILLGHSLGILVDKDNVINYQLVMNYRLLKGILTNQPTVDETIVLSTNSQ